MSLHCLKEICALVQHHPYHVLHYLLLMYEQYWTLLFDLNLENLCLLQFHHLVICGMKVETAEILFVFASSKSFSVGYVAPGVSSFSILMCESWLLIEFSLEWEKAWSTKSPYDSNFILFLFFVVYFKKMVENLIAIIFHLWKEEAKAAHDEQIFKGEKSLFATIY